MGYICFLLDIHKAYRYHPFSSGTVTRLCELNNVRPILQNTVRLSLALRFSADLIVLFQCGALLLVQHLTVVFDQHYMHFGARQLRLPTDPSCLVTVDTSHLYSLTLCNIRMDCLLEYIEFLRLNQLKTLCLFNIVDDSK